MRSSKRKGMNAQDVALSAEHPHVLIELQYGSRWLPLRLVLEKWKRYDLDTVLMTSKGFVIRSRKDFMWYAWDAAYLTQRKSEGLYANTLLKHLEVTMKLTTYRHKTQPDWGFYSQTY